MRSINVAKLKAQLSAYLKRVKTGETVVVTDRDEPIAQIIPFKKKGAGRLEELVRLGLVQAATEDLARIKLTALAAPIDAQALLDEVREEG